MSSYENIYLRIHESSGVKTNFKCTTRKINISITYRVESSNPPKHVTNAQTINTVGNRLFYRLQHGQCPLDTLITMNIIIYSYNYILLSIMPYHLCFVHAWIRNRIPVKLVQARVGLIYYNQWRRYDFFCDGEGCKSSNKMLNVL